MKSYPSSQQVLDDLGDKVLDALRKSVDKAGSDLEDYRTAHPLWVAEHSEGGLASWIHDRIWSHFSALADSIDDVNLVDKEPTREICVGMNYRLRMKRHHDDGGISSYPTQGFMDFMLQEGQVAIEGLEVIKLVAGYYWNKDSRSIDGAVLSLRDGKENIKWRVRIDVGGEEEGEGTVVRPESPSPAPPTVDASTIKADADKEEVPE